METKIPVAKVNMRIPTDLLEELRRLARTDQRSLNGEVVWILRAFLEEKAKKVN